MADRDDAIIKLHEDVPLFREAIAFTAAKTGFNAAVIEKDYFCTVLLGHFARHGGADLIFKGGTCLAKVHVGFYRLSEDLDFAIPMPVDASRSERSRAADAIKQAVAGVSQRLPGFSCEAELKGSNDSAQYSGVVTYRSVLSDEPQTILIDVSVREPSLTPPATLSAQTVLMDPISGQSAVPGLEVACINALEAMAEKFRAALSRRDVAIRDFFDLDYAMRKLPLELGSASFGDMVRRKLAIPDNPPVDVGGDRMAALRRQVDAKLKPMLREEEFRDFDLDRAIALVVDMANRAAWATTPIGQSPARPLAGPPRGCVEFGRLAPPHLTPTEKGRLMLSPTTPLVMHLVLAAAVTLPAVAYAADAPHADAAAKDACIKACNECLRACRDCILGCDCPGCEKTCLTCIETCRTCVALLEYDSAMAEEMCEVCEEACEQCAAECTKCGDEPCCKACEAACQKCHDACRAMRR